MHEDSGTPTTFDLTAERARMLFAYDQETGAITGLVTMGRRPWNAVAGTLDKATGYVRIFADRKVYGAHRLAWLLKTGEWPAGHIDHINGDRADNRWSNLRDVSVSTNIQNQRAPKSNNTTGFLGVSQIKSRYRATIIVKGKQTYLGSFGTPEEAHAVYLAAKRRLHVGCTI